MVLRTFSGRLVCDACEGIFCSEPDLTVSLSDFTHIECTVSYFDTVPGARPCPTCASAMETCRVRLDFAMLDKHPKTPPRVDRCTTHGLWFDKDELAAVLEVASHVSSPGGGNAGPAPSGGNFGIGGRAWALTKRR